MMITIIYDIGGTYLPVRHHRGVEALHYQVDDPPDAPLKQLLRVACNQSIAHDDIAPSPAPRMEMEGRG